MRKRNKQHTMVWMLFALFFLCCFCCFYALAMRQKMSWYSCARDIYPILFECEMCYRKLRLFLFIFLVCVLALSCDSMSMCHRVRLWTIIKRLMGKERIRRRSRRRKGQRERENERKKEKEKCSNLRFWWTWFESWSSHFYRCIHVTIAFTRSRKRLTWHWCTA